jgi:hypothetical protein
VGVSQLEIKTCSHLSPNVTQIVMH